MSAYVQVMNRSFGLLDEFGAITLGARSWMLNGIGGAEFQIAVTDPKAHSRNIRFGNMVKVISDLGVPPWVGRIDQIIWSTPDRIIFNANGLESVMRGVPVNIGEPTDVSHLEWYFNTYSNLDTGGPIIRGIRVGSIYSESILSASGSAFSGANTAGDFWDSLVMPLADTVKAEFYVDHATGLFYMQKRVGVDKSNLVVIEQSDLVGTPELSVNLEPVIWWCRYVGGQDVGGRVAHDEWIDYEIKQLVQDERGRILEFPDSVDDSEGGFLERRAWEEVEKSIEQAFTLDLSIHNERGLMKNFFLGDVIGVRLTTLGWAAYTKWRPVAIEVTQEGTSNQIRLTLHPDSPREILRVFNSLDPREIRYSVQ